MCYILYTIKGDLLDKYYNVIYNIKGDLIDSFM